MALLTDLISHIASIFGLISSNYNENAARDGIHECSKGVRRINRALQKASSIGEKQKLMAQLRNIKTFMRKFKGLRKQGQGLTTRKQTATHRVHWDDSISAFDSRIRSGVISNLKHKDTKGFLIDCRTLFKRRIQNILKNDEAVKVNAVFAGEFVCSKGDKLITEYKYFTTSNSPIYKDIDIDKWFEVKVIQPIMTDLEEFQERDSGWSLKAITNLGVNINKFVPQLGSSYIELPRQIRQKNACINVKNDDSACFAWAVVSALYPVETNAQRLSKYPHYSKILNLKGIQFPMTIRQIPNFEKQNNISINVYILQKQKKQFTTLPRYLTENKKDRHVNLLLIQDVYGNNNTIEDRYHFVWIKDLSRMVSTQLSRENGRKYFCDRCLHYYRSQEKLDSHTTDCIKLNKTAIKMPEEGKNICSMKNFKNKEKCPFVIYADMESILKSTNNKKQYQVHIPAAVGYYLKCSYDDSLSLYRSYRGEDCMKWFADELMQLSEDLETVFLCPYDIDISFEEEMEFQKATTCHVCEKPFKSEDVKVRDHNHLLPHRNYRGPAHEGCNINYQDSHTIPVVFHNLSGYDAHFIIEDIATRMDGRVDLLPLTKEKYISFTKHIQESTIQFRFIDSLRFLNSSLDTLASYLEEFPILKSVCSDLSEEQLLLLTRKGIYPYDFMNSFEKFNYTSLPSQDQFFNRLENKRITSKQYRCAEEIWERFNIKSLGEYSDLYMKTDILLLADVFEQFRSSCLKTYGLDSAHYFTLPGFTWDAMLKYTKQELELITDQDMFLFIERGIRGGLSQVCSKRCAKANNEYVSDTYNSSKPASHLMYYDINNQYGWAMSQSLPYAGFKWTDTNIDVTRVPDDCDTGYILEVSLQYPHNLHDHHKDLPFCPEHINPKTGKPPNSSSENVKLMATLRNKDKYVIHYRALKQALVNGLLIKSIHRVLKFKQSPWLKSYIDLNTSLRKAAKNEFEKNLFKLMNNAVFGKTMENIRNRVNIKLLTKWLGRYGAEAWISKPEFKNCTIFNENLVAVELQKLQIFLNKPIYAGMAILDLAKTTIYNFHYEYMKNTFGDDCTVLYTDTDSLIYEIMNQDPYKSMKRDCHMYFDTSDYPYDNIYGIPQVNKKVLGMMKDEFNGVPMTDFIGLRSKLYTTKCRTSDNEKMQVRNQMEAENYTADEIDISLKNIGVTKKAKGVKKSVVQSKITFENYVDCLENFSKKVVEQNLIKSTKHQVSSVIQEKIALNPYDDKRYLIPGTNLTLPWGHYSIEPMDPDIED